MAAVALGENVKTYTTIQCKFLLILKMGVPVFIGASWMQFTELWLTFWWSGELTYSTTWDCKDNCGIAYGFEGNW